MRRIPLYIMMLLVALLLSLAQNAVAADAVNPRQEIERQPGNTQAALKHLGTMLQDRFRKNIFAEFDAPRTVRPSDAVHYAATRILSLHRMGKVSVHSPEVKSAFTFEFLTARADPTRLHEALALYERIAVANSDDPTWRLIRARCARLMDLPETLKLYEQVAADMTGVPPSEDVRKLWEANRDEFNLPDYTKAAWRKQITKFVYDAKGLDVPGSPPINGSPLPFIDIAGTVGTDAAEWEGALDDLSNASPKTLDGFYADAKKFGELPWLNGRGFLNTEQALNAHLLSMPSADLVALRQLQEVSYLKATAIATEAPAPLVLFRRYPWSVSAQAQLLKTAQRHVFEDKPQSAYRGFKDVLQHAQTKESREHAQVGLWVSLAQFAQRDAVPKAFESIDADATWPWYGKREKAAVIKAALVKVVADQTPAPTLASLKLHTVQLPPAPAGATNQQVFNVDLQRRGDRLLASSDGQLVMYDATNPGKPIWNHAHRVSVPRAGKTGVGRPFAGAGAGRVLPLLDEKHVAASWGGNGLGQRPVITLRRGDGEFVNVANPHEPHSRHRYRTLGSPAAADGNIYAVQLQQPYLSINSHPEYPGWGDVSLSCFARGTLEHRWTRVYPIAGTNMSPSLSCFRAVLPQISEGALFFCTNDGHVIRTDARDGELEWIHFFRPLTNDGYSLPASPRCQGARPIVTDDKVICMPKFTGYLFALDKATGRRLWRTPILRGHEVLGVHQGAVLVVAANSLYAIDVNTGKMQWGRSIAKQYADGFQLPRAQLIGSSIYTGTKNKLYRFDANSGALLESRNWAMSGQVPMSFLVSGTDLYAISDLPMRDAALERQLVEYHTVIQPAGGHKDHPRPIERKDGSTLIWRECMLMCVKDGKLAWSRFVSNDKVYQSRFSERGAELALSWSAGRSGSSAVHDSATGKLLRMHRSGAPGPILIGGK